MTVLKPGLYPGLSRSEYEAINAINHSTLKHYGRSPAHARWQEMNPSEPTAALTIGDATHAYLLEPERYAEQYAMGLDRPRRNKEDRTAWAEWEEDNEGKISLKPSEVAAIEHMAQAVRNHPIANAVLNGDGSSEVCVVWRDERTGLDCKGLVDRYGEFNGYPVIADLKTTDDASPSFWGRSVARFGYHTQAAWYWKGFKALSDVPRRFIFIVVEKKPPHGCCLYELNADAMFEGQHLNEKRLQMYLKCKDEGKFPSYGAAVQVLRLPRYALTHLDEEEA